MWGLSRNVANPVIRSAVVSRTDKATNNDGMGFDGGFNTKQGMHFGNDFVHEFDVLDACRCTESVEYIV